jgi:glyoxylase I family protein
MPMPQLPPANHASPLASIRGSHVALRMPDYEAATRWYADTLDFRLIHEWPYGDLRLAYMAPATDDRFWVEILGGGSPAPRPRFPDLDSSLNAVEYHHFCLQVDSVDETLAELRKRGASIVGEPFDLEPISRRLAFFEDPWGNRIELMEVLR